MAGEFLALELIVFTEAISNKYKSPSIQELFEFLEITNFFSIGNIYIDPSLPLKK